jgi:hypothetical protein
MQENPLEMKAYPRNLSLLRYGKKPREGGWNARLIEAAT